MSIYNKKTSEKDTTHFIFRIGRFGRRTVPDISSDRYGIFQLNRDLEALHMKLKKMVCIWLTLVLLCCGFAGLPAAAADTFTFTAVALSSYIEVGATTRIITAPLPGEGGPAYTYQALDDVVSVDEMGVVIGLRVGSTYVMVSGMLGAQTYERLVSITVRERTNVFEFTVTPNPATIEAGENATLVVLPPARPEGPSYSFQMMTPDVAKIDDNGIVTGLKEGTAIIWIVGTKNGEIDTKQVTIKVNKKSGSELKKLIISSTTSLDKKVGDANFIFSVTFNTSKSNVEYFFSIDDEDVAAIDEYSGLVRIKRQGTAVITVEASADGYESATKDFNLYVGPAAGSTTGSGTTGTTSPATGTTGITGSTGTTITEGETVTQNGNVLDLKFSGKVTVNGMRFLTTGDFSVGTPFALIPDKGNGDWWKTPDAFSGSRGVYTAKNEGVATIIYADPTGKQYLLSVNTYKLKTDSLFQIPRVIPVGAVFGITPPVSGGQWTRQSDYLSGNGGVYIPLKAGSTKVSYEAGGRTYTLNLTVVDPDALESGALPPQPGETLEEAESGIILR